MEDYSAFLFLSVCTILCFGLLSGTLDPKFDKVKSRRVGLGGSYHVTQQNEMRKMTKMEKQRKAFLSDVATGNMSFGTSILQTLDNEQEYEEGGPLAETGSTADTARRNKGLMAEDDEDNSEDSGFEEDSDTVSKSGAAATPPTPFICKPKSLNKSQSMATLQQSKKLISVRVKKTKKKPRKVEKSAYAKKLENGTFGDEVLWNDPSDFTANKVLAFSENSISNSHHDGA